MKRFIWLLVLSAIALLISACGSAPTISESKVISPVAEKVRTLQFVYRKPQMRTVSSSSYGTGVQVGDTGIENFGPLVAKQAESIFAVNQIKVRSAKVQYGSGPIAVDATPQTDGGSAGQLLVVSPESATVTANRMSTRTNYVFTVALIDPQSKKMTWRAKIDTSTWKGTDIVMKNIEGQTYNEAYATQLLNVIVQQMKNDGVI
jgi:hypothetical protein